MTTEKKGAAKANELIAANKKMLQQRKLHLKQPQQKKMQQLRKLNRWPRLQDHRN